MAAQIEKTDGALELTSTQINRLRILGTVAFLASFVGMIASFFLSKETPGLLLGVYGIGGIVALSIALIGRLPNGFELLGREIRYDSDDVDDLAALIQEVDEDLQNPLTEVLSKWIDEESLETVRDRTSALEPSKTPQIPTVSKIDHSECLGSIVGSGNVQRDYSVPNAGVGKPPILDLHFSYQGRGFGVTFPRSANKQIKTVTTKRVQRSLTSTEVDYVFIAVPSALKADYDRLFGSVDRTQVVDLDDLTREQTKREIQAAAASLD